MPRLVFYGRYYRVASDELWLLGGCAVVGRIFWTAFLCASIGVSAHFVGHCPQGWLMFLYLSLSVLLFAISIVCEIGIIMVSTNGTMVEHARRDKELPQYLYVHVFLGILQFGAALFGISVIAGVSDLPCSSKFTLSNRNIEVVLLSIVVLSQLIDTLAVAFWIWVFKSSKVEVDAPRPADSPTALLEQLYEPNSDLSQTNNAFWEKQLRFLCKSVQICSCNIFGGSKVESDLEAVARVFTLFFSHSGMLDVVPSDIVAGLILVRMQQLQSLDEAHARMLTQAQVRSKLAKARSQLGALSPQQKRQPSPLGNVEMTDNADADAVDEESKGEAGATDVESQLRPAAGSGSGAHSLIAPSASSASSSAGAAAGAGVGVAASDIQFEDADFEDLEEGVLELTESSPLNVQSPEHRLLMQDLYKYSVFALATYSHLLALYMQPVTGVCGLCVSRMRYVGGDDNSVVANYCCCCLASKQDQDNHQHHHHDDSCSCYCCLCCIAPKSLRLSTLEDCMGTPHDYGSGTSQNMDGQNEAPPFEPPRRVMGDNCLKVNEAGMLHICKGKNRAQLVYASFRNDSLCKPYAIFDDPSNNTVVVAVRGTLSLEDCVTDVLCESMEMTEIGKQWGFDGEGRKAHGGMLKAAMRIRAEIEKYGHLAWAMNRDHSRQEAEQGHRHNQNQRQNNSNSNNQNQNQGEGQGQGQGQEQSRSPASRQLVVVGHSLGAGTAVLLSFLLRRAYPHLRCFTYGTPGSMLDPVTARECASWVTSCVLGHDLVCRLSFKALSDLRAEVLDCMARAKVNKMKILQAVFKKDFNPNNYMHPRGHTPDSKFKRALDQFTESMTSYEEHISQQLGFTQLVIPGRIIHLQKQPRHSGSTPAGSPRSPASSSSNAHANQRGQGNGNDDGSGLFNCPWIGSRSQRRAYHPAEASIELFSHLALSPSMGWEHLPDQYLIHLEKICKNWGLETSEVPSREDGILGMGSNV